MKRFLCMIFILVLSAAALAVTGCGPKRIQTEAGADASGHSAPTAITAAVNRAILEELPFADQQDFEEARRGLIAQDAALKVGDDENIIFDQTAYRFMTGEAPPSVNPSLWRQASLNNIHGLFKVTDGIYQLRGFDLSNMTIIEGKTGWIVVDPLTSVETASRALAFARRHLGEKPVSAILYTHSHVDHFGGVLGVVTAADAARNQIPIIGPKGFMAEATSENILAGPTMLRRAVYMYGRRLDRSPRGHVGSGLGKAPAFGTVSILPPTRIVDQTPQEMQIDGVRFIFQYAPGSEAPAEFTFYLPDARAFCGAEIVSRHMHNLYTPRGAKVRDALAWSNYIEEARLLFRDADIYFASHHWPIWGQPRIQTFLKQQRDTYKYIHDQTLRLAHSGFTPLEIADQLQMPPTLRKVFSSRGYYGTLRHNARAVYQFYYGWFDGNPANLNPLPPVESARKTIDFMGGAGQVLTKAHASFEKGEYRWTAEVLNKLVFAEPDNVEAKALLARTYDQLGYQAESGPWRDIYLTGAYELRHGVPETGFDLYRTKGLLKHTSLSRFFDALAARLNGPEAEGLDLKINFIFTDLNETHVLWIENAVLHHRKGAPDPNADAALRLTHDFYLDMALGKAKPRDALFSDKVSFDGNVIDIIRFFRLFQKPDTTFDIVTP